MNPVTDSLAARLWELSSDLHGVADADGRLIDVNPAWEDVLGHPVAELLELPPLALVHPDDRDATRAILGAAAEDGRLPPFENRNQHADGSYRVISWSGRLVDGRWYGCGRDVTEMRARPGERLAGMGTIELHLLHGLATLSEGARELLGADAPQTGLAALSAALLADDRDRVREQARATLADGEARSVEVRYRRGDDLRWADAVLEPLLAEGRKVGLRAIVRDITDRKRTEHDLRLQATLLDAVDAAVIATDMQGRVTHWNTGAERLYGWTRDEVSGRQINELTVGPQDRELAEAITESIRRHGAWEGEFDVVDKAGRRFRAYVRDSLVTGADGVPVGLVGVSVDVSVRTAIEDRLRAAHHFLSTVTDRMGEGLYTVDGGGRVTFMNPAAERLLGWREDELLGHSMHATIHYRRPDGSPFPEAECPVMSSRRDGTSVQVGDDVFYRRDGTALPVAYTSTPFTTDSGERGWVVVFQDITERKAREQELERRVAALSKAELIRTALVEDRFELFAQPILDIRTREVVQHELLIRMRGRDGRLLTPGEFLPTAEEHGLVADIDRWVVRQAAALAAQGHAVELNLSARSIGDPRFGEFVSEQVEAAGADPRLMVLELTETALLADESAGRAFVERVERLGCQVALDDFGTGYGGFHYLKHLPVDFLKIDIEFVRDLVENQASRHVVQAVVNLARGFGQQTVAEGVEDESVLTMLEEMGVDFAQGYALGRPRPLKEVYRGGRTGT